MYQGTSGHALPGMNTADRPSRTLMWSLSSARQSAANLAEAYARRSQDNYGLAV